MLIRTDNLMKNAHVPDVTAFPLDQALSLLENHSVSYYVKKALPFPPLRKFGNAKNKGQHPPGYRVIRQTEGEAGMVELVIAPEATV